MPAAAAPAAAAAPKAAPKRGAKRARGGGAAGHADAAAAAAEEEEEGWEYEEQWDESGGGCGAADAAPPAAPRSVSGAHGTCSRADRKSPARALTRPALARSACRARAGGGDAAEWHAHAADDYDGILAVLSESLRATNDRVSDLMRMNADMRRENADLFACAKQARTKLAQQTTQHYQNLLVEMYRLLPPGNEHVLHAFFAPVPPPRAPTLALEGPP